MTALNDLDVVITGGLTKMSRNEAFDFIRSQGGRPHKKISGRTNLLVVGSTPWKTQKLSFSEDHWTINVITEKEFYELCGI